MYMFRVHINQITKIYGSNIHIAYTKEMFFGYNKFLYKINTVYLKIVSSLIAITYFKHIKMFKEITFCFSLY